MNILFVHQNMPGQYRELVQWLGSQGGHRICFLTQRTPAPKVPGVLTCVYKPHREPAGNAYGLSKVWEAAAGVGFGAAMAAKELSEKESFVPDIIIGHAGWGELLFFRQLWPDVPIIGLFEYYYNMTGGTIGFEPDQPVTEHTPYITFARNTVPLTNFEVVDLGHAPTVWQRDLFPKRFHDQLYVCHDGIRTDRLLPSPDVQLRLGRLARPLSRKDEVITYVARNLERTRGFHILMRALPRIMKERPNARVLIVGGNEVSYGKESDTPGGLRAEMESEVGHLLDWDRLHFLGRVPYSDFMKIIQISRCHIYLSMPFVLSWSLLEAMSMQATIVASDVPSVREAIDHGKTGMLVEFFDHEALAAQVVDVLANPAGYANLGPAARAHVVKEYDFLTHCLPEHIAQINRLVSPEKRINF